MSRFTETHYYLMWNVDAIKSSSHKKSESWVMARSFVGNDRWDHWPQVKLTFLIFFPPAKHSRDQHMWRWNQNIPSGQRALDNRRGGPGGWPRDQVGGWWSSSQPDQLSPGNCTWSFRTDFQKNVRPKGFDSVPKFWQHYFHDILDNKPKGQCVQK